MLFILLNRASLTDASGAAFARQYLHAAGRTLEHRARLFRTGEQRAGVHRVSLAVTGQTRVVEQADVPASGHFLPENPATCGTQKPVTAIRARLNVPRYYYFVYL